MRSLSRIAQEEKDGMWKLLYGYAAKLNLKSRNNHEQLTFLGSRCCDRSLRRNLSWTSDTVILTPLCEKL